MSEPKPKTPTQRNAEHVWFRMCAEFCNEHGIEKRVVIDRLSDRGIDMPWTEESWKEDVWKPILEKVTGATSTEDESTTDIDFLYSGLTRWFAQTFGETLPPFPSNEYQPSGEL